MSAVEPSPQALLGGLIGTVATPALGGFTAPALIRCMAGSFSGGPEPGGVTAFRGIRYGRAERLRPPIPYRYSKLHRAEEFGMAHGALGTPTSEFRHFGKHHIAGIPIGVLTKTADMGRTHVSLERGNYPVTTRC